MNIEQKLQILKAALEVSFNQRMRFDSLIEEIHAKTNFDSEVIRELLTHETALSEMAIPEPAPANSEKSTSAEDGKTRYYKRKEDEEILPDLIRVKRSNPKLGYRKITELINSERELQGLPTLNKKRILRLLNKFKNSLSVYA